MHPYLKQYEKRRNTAREWAGKFILGTLREATIAVNKQSFYSDEEKAELADLVRKLTKTGKLDLTGELK